MTDRTHWCTALFATIDAKDSRGFIAYLSDDAQFRYGSARPVTGTEAILAALDGFFSSVTALSHRVSDLWEVPGHLICRGEVRYERPDGTVVTVPFCNVFTMCAEKIARYEIYLDPTPLVAA